MENTSHLAAGHGIGFWIEGFIMMTLVFLVIKNIFSDPYKPESGFWNWIKGWFWHYKKDYFLSVAIPYIAMVAREWAQPMFNQYTSFDLPHSDNDFLYFIPFTAIVAWRTSLAWHKHD